MIISQNFNRLLLNLFVDTSVKHTCYTLKMSQFIRLLLGEETLPEWEAVHNEFIGLRESKGSSFILELIKDITYLHNKQYIINECIKFIVKFSEAGVYARDLCIELKLAGCKGKFDWADKVGFSNDLRAAQSYSKKFSSQIKRKETELEAYNKKHSGVELSMKVFDDWQVELTRFMHVYIDYDLITVSSWCAMMNKFDKYREVQNAENNNLINKKRG